MQITIELPENIAEGLESRWSAIQASPCFLLDAVCSKWMPIHPPFDLLSLSWIWHFPPVHQALDCCSWKHRVPISVLRVEKITAGLHVHDLDTGVIRSQQIENLASYLTAEIRRIPNEIVP